VTSYVFSTIKSTGHGNDENIQEAATAASLRASPSHNRLPLVEVLRVDGQETDVRHQSTPSYRLGVTDMSSPTQACQVCGDIEVVRQDGRGFPPDIAKRKLAKRCKAKGHTCKPQYRAGFLIGPRPRGMS
jgi:hypothetical protein